jgi:heterogeneous nuclear ribonucleoprotein F/H
MDFSFFAPLFHRRRRRRRRHIFYPSRYHLSGIDGSQLMPGQSSSMDPLEALLGSFPCARVRGIPYEATLEDVLIFFQGLVVIDVVLVSSPHPEEELGEAFVVFANPMDFQMGLQR